jgi:hypothetical protein
MVNLIKENQATEEQDADYDTSDKEQVNKVRKKYARTRADRLKFIEAAMSHEQGRAWFYDVLLFCKVFQGPFTDDPYKTAFLCGEQNVGLRILDDIQTAAPDNYNKMISENKTKNG